MGWEVLADCVVGEMEVVEINDLIENIGIFRACLYLIPNSAHIVALAKEHWAGRWRRLREADSAGLHWKRSMQLCFSLNRISYHPSFVTFRENLVRPNFEPLSPQRLEDFQEIETQNAGFFLKIISLTSVSTSVSGSHEFLLVGEFGKWQKRDIVMLLSVRYS